MRVTEPVGPEDDELHLFGRRLTHDRRRRVAGDNQTLVYHIRGLASSTRVARRLVASV
jgi:hypothetical protein